LGTGDGHWWRHGVIYQIYPRSFADANGDGVGDLAGITSRLDHLNDGTPGSLGVDAIWLSPFYPSPMADFGYDVADYTDVDPVFGTLDDFDRLVAEAHARGIRVVVDLVPNHTSDRHPWFLESRSSRDSPKRDWYVWADSRPDGGPPNNWTSSFPRAGAAWTFDEATGQWYLHSFMPQQPDLNWWNPEVREAMDEVMRFWLDRGVDGFRVDVAHKMARDPELLDNPLVELDADDLGDAPEARTRRLAKLKSVPRRDEDWPEVHEIARRFRRTLDAYDDRMAVGEVYLLDLVRLARYYGAGQDEFHLAHNFVFQSQPWKAEAFRAVVDEFIGLLPPGAWPAWMLSNHDVSRIASRYDEGGNGRARARVAAMLLLTLRGTPFLYMGDEIGQADGEIPPDRVVDVDGRDPERTPVQWDGSPDAGFSARPTGASRAPSAGSEPAPLPAGPSRDSPAPAAGEGPDPLPAGPSWDSPDPSVQPWLPVAPEAASVNVAAQRDDPASMLSLVRRLIWHRKGSPALHGGDYRSLPDAPGGCYAYLRSAGDERLLVALNFTGQALEYPVGEQERGRLELSTDPERATGGELSLRPLRLGPDEGVIVRLA
jgi:alpha-glucosidase